MVSGAGHAAPPAAVQLTAVHWSPATAGSWITAPSASEGPALAAVTVYSVVAPARVVVLLLVLLIDNWAERVLIKPQVTSVCWGGVTLALRVVPVRVLLVTVTGAKVASLMHETLEIYLVMLVPAAEVSLMVTVPVPPPVVGR